MISEIHTHEDPILTREEAIEILNTPDDQLDMLIERAGILRKKYKGNRVSIHILTNVRSGNCTQDCAYCAQSCRSSADIEKYKWVSDEKLYRDNDFVNKNHLARHCIGLSGMKFTDAELTARMISDQKNGWPFCPRCGKPLKIDPQTQRAASSNALSREVSGLYICDDCGSDEALRAFAGLPLPLEEWDQTRLINSMYK